MRVGIAKLIGGAASEPSWASILDVSPKASKLHKDEYRMQ